MNIKLFENFEESPDFFQRIGPSLELNLYNEPYPLRNGRIAGGEITWKCDLDYRKWGIELGLFQLTKIVFEIELEDEEKEEEYIKEIVVPKEALQDINRYKTTVKGFPLTLTRVDIYMRHSEDPEDWKYEIEIGSEPE